MKIRTSSHWSTEAPNRVRVRSQRAFTLAEVLIAMAITVMSLGGVITGCIIATRQAECSACSLAAQSLATQRLEQTRAAKWDPRASPPVDEVITNNFPIVPTNILDMPVSGTNIAYATNFTTISDVTNGGDPPELIPADFVLSFRQRVFTHTIAPSPAPDQSTTTPF